MEQRKKVPYNEYRKKVLGLLDDAQELVQKIHEPIRYRVKNIIEPLEECQEIIDQMQKKKGIKRKLKSDGN